MAMVLVILQAFNLMLRIIAHAVVLAYNILSFFVTSLIQKQVSGPSSWPEGVQFELHTLPVHAKLIGDGDGMIVHVNIKDMRESGAVPIEVQEAAIKRRQARAIRDYVQADALHKSIMNCGYRVVTANNEEILAREYRIRLRRNFLEKVVLGTMKLLINAPHSHSGRKRLEMRGEVYGLIRILLNHGNLRKKSGTEEMQKEINQCQ